MALADQANAYVEEKQPWKLKKEEGKEQEVQDVCTVALNLFRQIVIYLAPILPRLAEQTETLLGRPIAHWSESETPLLGTEVAKFKPMLQRLDADAVEALFLASQESA